MEGRVPPSVIFEINKDSPLSPGRPETYVIQIPKDQIYRIPPPENAEKAEHFRKPDTHKKALTSPCMPKCGWLLCMGIALVAFSIVFTIAISYFYFALNPKNPNFSITRFVIVEKANPKSHMTYEITLKAENGNPRTGIYYESNGSVTLFSGKKDVGECRFPTLYQLEKSSTNIQLVVRGQGKRLNVTESGSTKSLAIKMEVPVTMNIGYMKIWRNEILANCEFKVRMSKKSGGFSKVLSQKCETQFNP